MNNVGFTHHYYPGLFGDPQNLLSHARTLGVTFPAVQAYLDAQQGPFLVGEFNVVFDNTGGERMMRRYFDEFADRGWMATAWSFKLLKPEGGVAGDNWYFVTNADPVTTLDLQNDSLATIESQFARLATMPLAVDEDLRSMLTKPEAKPLALPKVDPLPTSVPTGELPQGWHLYRIGDVPAGATSEGDTMTIVAGASSIFESADSFGFLAKPLADGESMTAVLVELLNSDRYAKAGLMFRGGDPASPKLAVCDDQRLPRRNRQLHEPRQQRHAGRRAEVRPRSAPDVAPTHPRRKRHRRLHRQRRPLVRGRPGDPVRRVGWPRGDGRVCPLREVC